MANFHKNARFFIDNLKFDKNDIIVEIGSDRCEGSTEWFDEYAKLFNVDFYSVDVVDYASKTLKHLSNTKFVITESGSKWTHNELPNINKKIKVLYLDNYDWLGPMEHLKSHELEQVQEYKNRGVSISNLDCQREHLHQMVGCLPYMAGESLVICDDTPYQHHSGIYIGKNGAVVPYLLSYGYEIIFGRGYGRECSEDNGVILYRKSNEILF
jgi:hypothetical protein